jgi:uncharacterized protein YoxC
MTFSLIEVLLLIIAIAGIVLVTYLMRLISQMSRTAIEVEELVRHLNYMRPQFERVLEGTEKELASIHELTKKADGIAGDVGSITHQATRLALPALTGLSSLAGPLSFATAALNGAKLGLKVLRGRNGHSAEDVESEDDNNTEEKSHSERTTS